MFEWTVMGLIIASSIKLAYDTYLIDLPENDPARVRSSIVDIFFNAFFILEAFVKTIGRGFVMDKGSYLRETWNQLDFFIVCSSIVDMSFENINLPIIKVLRLLRTLRPLRMISHNSAMKVIVEALLESVGSIFNVVIVVMMVWLMFAILGVNIFGGKFFYCSKDPY